MKSTIFGVICMTLLLGLAGGCGKSDESGTPARNVNTNPLPISPGTTITDKAKVYANLKKWYDATTENQNLGTVGIFNKKTQTINTGFQFNFQWCFFGQGNCQSLLPNTCYSKGPNGLFGVTSPTITKGVLSACNVAPADFNYTKKTNAALKRALNIDKSLTLLSATQTGTRYTLQYGSSGSFTATKMFIVDTNLHSLLNPIVEQDSSQIIQLDAFQVLYY